MGENFSPSDLSEKERDHISIHRVNYPNTQSFVPVICLFIFEASHKMAMIGFCSK